MTISLVGHGALLVWALVSFARPLENKALDTATVDIISADEFSQMVAGAQKAPRTETPKPLVEKIAETKPVEDITPKVVEKKEVTAAAEQTEPEPTPKPPDPKPAAAPPQPKEEAKTAEKKEPEEKVDPIAEMMKKDEAKKPEKKAESKPQPVQKPQPQQPKFDPRKVAALLDKRDPQRLAAAGATLNSSPSLGAFSGNAMQLSQNEIDALRARIRQCWTLPPGIDAGGVSVDVRMLLKRDGSLEVEPAILTRSTSRMVQAVAETATRAIRMCAPYTFLSPAKYEIWKDIEVTFDANWAAGM